MKIIPLNDRVLVKRIEEVQMTKGGIYIPDTAKEKPIEGKVVAVGSGKVCRQRRARRPDRQSRGPGSVRQICRHRN